MNSFNFQTSGDKRNPYELRIIDFSILVSNLIPEINDDIS